MKSPVFIVAITLTAAILVAASLLIFVGTRKSPGTSTWNAPTWNEPISNKPTSNKQTWQQRVEHTHLV